MFLKYLASVFFLFTCGIYCQHPEIDSLLMALTKKHSDTAKTSQHLLLSHYYYDFDMNKMKIHIDSSLVYSLRSNNYRLAEIYMALGVFESENEREIAARSYFDKALKVLDTNDDKTLRGAIYGNYSTTYDNSDNFEKELEYSLKAIELNKDNDEEACFLYYNHAVIYEDAGFHQEALYYLNLAKDIAERAKEYRIEAYALKSLALFAIDDKEFDKAENYLRRGIEICEASNSLEICYHMYFSLGKLQIGQGNYDSAEKSLRKARDFAMERNLEQDMIFSDVLLADLEYKKGNFKKAAQLFNSSNIERYKVEGLWYANIVYKNRSAMEEKIGNHQYANELLKKYIAFADSVHLSKNRVLLTQADRKYKVEKKNKEIATQRLALQKQEAEIQAKKTLNNYMLGTLLFLMATTTLVVFLFKQRQKRKNQELLTLKREIQVKTLESLIEGEEKERLRVAKELHDGVNGDLAAIKYKLSSLVAMNNTVIKEAIAMLDDSCKQVRAISHNLIPPSLENFDLLEATQIYCANLNEVISAVEIHFQHLGEAIDMTKKAEVNAFRIIQELVNNAIRHADASNINVQISSRENTVQITVEDDGKGFDGDQIESDGIGLANVRSRVAYLNGTTDFVSNEQGTSYTIDINKEELYGNENSDYG